METYMNPDLLPKNYKPSLDTREVQLASDAAKQFVEGRLRSDFNLFKHVSLTIIITFVIIITIAFIVVRLHQLHSKLEQV